MIVQCVNPFFDLVERVDREPGESWEVDKARCDEILAVTEYGTLIKVKESDGKPKAAAKKGGRATKAELTAQAESLGIEVPEGATNPEIAKLIEGAQQ